MINCHAYSYPVHHIAYCMDVRPVYVKFVLVAWRALTNQRLTWACGHDWRRLILMESEISSCESRLVLGTGLGLRQSLTQTSAIGWGMYYLVWVCVILAAAVSWTRLPRLKFIAWIVFLSRTQNHIMAGVKNYISSIDTYQPSINSQKIWSDTNLCSGCINGQRLSSSFWVTCVIVCES